MSSDIKTNGHISMPAFLGILGSVSASLIYFINLSIAPLQKDISQNSLSIHEMREDIVPRKEHEKDWAAQVKTDSDQDKRIEQMRQDFGGTYSLKDAIMDMKSRLETLEKEQDRYAPSKPN